MAKVRVSSEFRLLLSDKLMDLGNLSGAALILGQFIGDKAFSTNLFIVGLILMFSCYIISFVISR